VCFYDKEYRQATLNEEGAESQVGINKCLFYNGILKSEKSRRSRTFLISKKTKRRLGGLRGLFVVLVDSYYGNF
jgi:hypothetical protein